jgi:hypothetical protein
MPLCLLRDTLSSIHLFIDAQKQKVAVEYSLESVTRADCLLSSAF